MSIPTDTKIPAPRWASWTRYLADALLLTSGTVNIVVGTYKTFSSGPVDAAVPLAAGLLLLFAGTIDRFESLKGWGIEAKTRQLDKKIAESDELLTKLRRLTALVGKSIVQTNASIGRWGSAPKVESSYQMTREVQSLLLEVGVPREAVDAALLPWVRATAFDLTTLLRVDITQKVRLLLASFGSELATLQSDLAHSPEKGRMAELMQRLHRSQSDASAFRLLADGGPNDAVEVLRQITQAHRGVDLAVDTFLDEHVSPWVPELEHLAETGDLRQPERWYQYFKEKGR